MLLGLVELITMLALAVALSSYERRSMSLLHNRDAPIAYLLLGMGQPIADGGKLVMKTSIVIHSDVSDMTTTSGIPRSMTCGMIHGSRGCHKDRELGTTTYTTAVYTVSLVGVVVRDSRCLCY